MSNQCPCLTALHPHYLLDRPVQNWSDVQLGMAYTNVTSMEGLVYNVTVMYCITINVNKSWNIYIEVE